MKPQLATLVINWLLQRNWGDSRSVVDSYNLALEGSCDEVKVGLQPVFPGSIKYVCFSRCFGVFKIPCSNSIDEEP